MRITLIVPRTPVAKGRPEFCRRGGFVRAITPERTREYAKLVKAYASMHPQQELHGPLRFRVAFVFDLPISKWRKRNPVPRQWHTITPDWDNLGKAICDALNGIYYHDDASICLATVAKITEAQGGPAARCEILLEELPALELCASSQWIGNLQPTGTL